MRGALFAVVCMVASLGACGPKRPTSTSKGPEAGVAIALYRDGDTSYGIVDDRRWIEISGSSILLGNIDPGAALASLVIETPSPAVRIGPCTRERLPDLRDTTDADALERFAQEEARRAVQRERDRRTPRHLRPARVQDRSPQRTQQPVERFAPIVQCDVAGKPGKYLVRIVYVSTTLSYRVHHEVALRDPTVANVESRFVMETPHWRERAEVVLYDGVPGGLEPPREITRGMVTLDGGSSILLVPAQDYPAQLRRVFQGAGFDEEAAYDMDALMVWAILELPNVKLTPGPIRVHVALPGEEEERFIDIPAQSKRDRFAEPATADDKKSDEPMRIKLWIDPGLRGQRQRMIVENDGVRMVEIVTLSMANSGEAPREVWLEEQARPAKKRQIDRAWPKKPSARGDTIRNKLVVKPGRTERVGYTIIYDM